MIETANTSDKLHSVKSAQRTAFTLIELLVVIAIIAIPAAMLFLNRSRAHHLIWGRLKTGFDVS